MIAVARAIDIPSTSDIDRYIIFKFDKEYLTITFELP
jgi:hypothetical protein